MFMRYQYGMSVGHVYMRMEAFPPPQIPVIPEDFEHCQFPSELVSSPSLENGGGPSGTLVDIDTEAQRVQGHLGEPLNPNAGSNAEAAENASMEKEADGEQGKEQVADDRNKESAGAEVVGGCSRLGDEEDEGEEGEGEGEGDEDEDEGDGEGDGEEEAEADYFDRMDDEEFVQHDDMYGVE